MQEKEEKEEEEIDVPKYIYRLKDKLLEIGCFDDLWPKDPVELEEIFQNKNVIPSFDLSLKDTDILFRYYHVSSPDRFMSEFKKIKNDNIVYTSDVSIEEVLESITDSSVKTKFCFYLDLMTDPVSIEKARL
jgi:hypothetical protein